MKTVNEHVVIVVLPDAAEREDVCRQIEERGFSLRTYGGIAECLERLRREPEAIAACAVVPLSTVNHGGLRELRSLPHAINVVFLDAPLDIENVVHAMRLGAVGVVETGGAMHRLMAYIEEGVERSVQQREHERQCRETLTRLGSLSVGEHQVLQGIMLGKLNREIACQHHMSVRTIEQRRCDLFRKMNVQHAALLVRRVTEAVRTPVNWEKLDPDGRWLEAVRDDLAHAVIGRWGNAGTTDTRLMSVVRSPDVPPPAG
jgi:FixJ family two-component response regulator